MAVKWSVRYRKAILTSLSSLLPPESPELRIGALLRAAHELVSRTVYERTATAGYPELHPAHFRLLQFPGVDGVRPTELALRLSTTKQAVNPLLNDLERWGYIERQRDDVDRRGRVIGLTDRGGKLMHTIRRLHAEIERDWTTQLGPEGFQALRHMLEQLTEKHPTLQARRPRGVSRRRD